MYDYLVHLFSKSNNKKLMIDAISRNAIIVDVRTPEEFEAEHNKNAINVPLDKFFDHILRLKKSGNPIVVCCNSGIRAAKAITILKAAEVEAYNAGNWKKLSKI